MAKKLGKYFASIIELFNREIKPIGDKNIYENDVDNLYPNRVEIIEKNSVTAISASGKLKAFIVGKGFVNQSFNEMIVNKPKKMKGYHFLDKVANSLKTHKGAYIHVNYDFEGKVNYLDVLPYKKCRRSKEDDLGNNGLIYYKDWSKGQEKGFATKKENTKWFYPYNSDNKIILDQRKRDLKEANIKSPKDTDIITEYRGQVYFLTLEEDEIYPSAWINPAYNDADSEFRLSLYRNTGFRNGFLDKTIVIPNGLDEETSTELEEEMRKWLGSENSSSLFMFAPDTVVDDPSKIITVVSLKGSYDSKRFDTDEKALANNIRKAYLTIPKILIDPEDSFFGSSGEAFKEAIKYYNNETLFIREKIAYMMDLFYNGDFTIAELGSEDLITGGENE